ncbi:2-oxoglutarate dehydrogenase E1 component [Coemansia guatemalensis]|uniref:2-oxoglutarate dehydrogenase E1 component n=1 Tax=Coemansia guatemalensis TaxID=2761395 RepID=A0A9W8HU16_9FUNG|nr:2-oxoglutarate dehydrogenase E1 component [Coemansia guatemalensis]
MHLRHREAVCDYMQRHPDEFAPFIDDETCSFDQYVFNMRRPGVYGGNLELVAFSRNYRVDIDVYQLGGTVFVISGAPPNNPSDPARSMPAVHIAYHSYEHYSSVRNKNGPHCGLPDVKARSAESRFRLINAPSDRPVIVGLSDPFDFAQDQIPVLTEVSDDSGDDEPDGNLDASAPPTSKEKIIMGSTGVANLALVRRLLRHHSQDEVQVIELLIQWMSNDNATVDQWWAEDGPADYDGSVISDPPTGADTAIPEASAEPTIDTSADAEKENSDEKGQVIVAEDKLEERDEDDKNVDKELSEEPENVADNIAEDISKPAKARPDHHPKGAARRKKAQTKKQRKEAAKLKKRQAARASSAGDNPDSTSASVDHNPSQQMNRIYI